MLYKAYAGKMMTICLRYSKDKMEAEDIFQEGFIRIFQYIHQFKFEGSFEGWLRRIIVNTALKNVSKKRISFAEVNDLDDHSGGLPPYAYSNLGAEDILKLINISILKSCLCLSLQFV